MELRPYQRLAVDAGVEFLKSNKKTSGLIVAPTSSGKSWYIASIAKELEGNTLVLQPSREIGWQNYEKMKFYFNEEDIGIYSASMNRKDINKITIATIGSIINKKELFSNFQNLLIDEAHCVSAKGGMYNEFINYFGGKCIGLTATSYRLHSYQDMRTGNRSVVAKFLHRTRPRIFTEIINITQIKELYQQGFLCPIEYIINPEYKQSEIKLNTTGMDFDEKSLEEYNEKKNIINIIKKNIEELNSSHILVFVSSVKEAYQLSDKLNEINITCETVSAKTPKDERENIINLFKKGYIKVISNFGALTTGFDFPELDTIILARPTQSVSLYQQMIGRVMRIAPNKEKGIVIDICGNVEKFGRIETFEIYETKKGLHRLRSNVGNLTGFDFINNVDLEKNDYKDKKEVEWNTGEIIRFGKYKGIHITKIPNSYLNWVIENIDNKGIRDMFIKEKERRNKNVIN